jgi:redox-sensitive bicupin YhaK (pirin superfamily)
MVTSILQKSFRLGVNYIGGLQPRVTHPRNFNMTQTIRLSSARGFADHGWLKSFHSFSFGSYYDPNNMGFGNLRVINEDRIAPHTGFGRHGHRNMEIVSLVQKGALGHQDSMGNASTILPGQIQRMTAGTGVEHSEMNQAQGAETHFLQIWLLPNAVNLAPEYEQTDVDLSASQGHLTVIAEPKPAAGQVPRPGCVGLNADARLLYGQFDGAQSHQWQTPAGRLTYVHVISGQCALDGQPLQTGDAVALTGPATHCLDQGTSAQVLVFDLAP